MTTEIESTVEDNYAGSDLQDRIYRAVGKATPGLRDLAPYDEFHIGGWHATGHLFARMEPQADMRILDIGSGLGGAARYCADMAGAHVTGIDLSRDYVDTAQALSFLTGLSERTDFRVGDAAALPFEKQAFDMAYTIHVAMNIEDKAAFYKSVHRVLKPGAVFGIYDVLAEKGAKPVTFPVPWAAKKDMSFLATLDEMKKHLKAAKFEIVESENRRDFALQALARMQAAGDSLGLQIVMGDNYKKKTANLAKAVGDGRITPWQIICRVKE
jgi:ubiquinone/menaquinone biosynthesis C-methylase UbiE